MAASPRTPTRPRARARSPEALSSVRRQTHLALYDVSADEPEDRFSPKRPRPPALAPAPEVRSVAGALWARASGWLDRAVTTAAESYPMVAASAEFLYYGVDLGFRSVRWFRFGIMAVWLGFRLCTYSAILLPAFLQVVYPYYHDPRLKRRIRFGPEQRNYVDIYIPAEAVAAQEGRGPRVPVVIAVMGGAWIMGHRAWNAQLGLRLMDFGVLVCAVDYRNFPLGQVPDMVQDISRAIGWVFENVDAYGGDPSNVLLLAQSAGAHLCALLLLEHSLLEATAGKEDSGSEGEASAGEQGPVGQAKAPASNGGEVRGHRPSRAFDRWSVSGFKGFLGISGPYDLVALEPHLVSRGIYSRILYSLAVDGDLAGCSPTRVLKTADWRASASAVAGLLPPILLFHGGADKSVPAWSTRDFAESLRDMGVSNVKEDVRPGVTHTYPVIEGPMAGEDPQVQLALPFLLGAEEARKRLEASPRPRMWPQFILDMASVIMPY